MPRKPGPHLAKQTETQLAALRTQVEHQLQAAKDALAALNAETKARQEALRAKEERRLGQLAYAAGLAGMEAGVLEKHFAEVAAMLQKTAEEAV